MSERWKPEHGKTYCFVNSSGHVNSYTWEDDSVDYACYEFGNCFKAEKEAEAAAEKVKALLLSLHYNGTSTANSETLKDTFTKHLKKIAEQPVTNCNQLPKLTVEVFDREDCPAWAKYAAVCANGSVRVFLNKPTCQYRMYWSDSDSWWEQTLHGVKYDASYWQKSLIERPVKETKLPDWCKVGKWVYNKDFHEYIKVVERTHNTIKGKDIHGGVYHADFQFKNTVPARLRTWTAREAIGKVICWQGDYSFQENIATINAVDCDGDLMGDLIGNIKLEDLTRECFYQPDGSPCGFLEHLENGEWVE